MQQAKNFSISVYFCENEAGCFAVGLAKKVICPGVGGGKAVGGHNMVHADSLYLVSLVWGQNMEFFPPLLNVLEVFTRNFHSKLQGSPEPRLKQTM